MSRDTTPGNDRGQEDLNVQRFNIKENFRRAQDAHRGESNGRELNSENLASDRDQPEYLQRETIGDDGECVTRNLKCINNHDSLLGSISHGLGGRPSQQDTAGIYTLTHLDLNQTTPITFLESLFDVISTNLSFMDSESQQHCGSTLNVTLQTTHENTINITTANTGDSRAIIVENTRRWPTPGGWLEREAPNGPLWKVTILSTDHKPGDPLEKEYIEANGGQVTLRSGSPHQLNHSLSISRAFGDNVHQGLGIRHSPDFTQITIPVYPEGFVINACDGLWDVVSPNDVAAYITLLGDDADPVTLANGLRQLAWQAWQASCANPDGSAGPDQSDNISVVVTPIIHKGEAPVLSFVADGHGGSFVSQFIHQQISEFETAPELIKARISAQTYLTKQINETPDLQHSPQELANILYAFVNALDKFQNDHPDSSKLETCQALAIDLLRQKKPKELLGGLFSKIGAAIAADNHQGGYGNFFRTHRFRDCLTAARTAAYEALSPNHKIVLLYDETITKLESYNLTHQGQKREAASILLGALDDARNKIMEGEDVLNQLKQYLTLPYLTQRYVNIRSELYKISLESSNKLYELLHQRDLSLLTQESHKEILKLYHETTQDIELYISKHSSNSRRNEPKTLAAEKLLKQIENPRKKLQSDTKKNNNTTTVTTVLDPCIGLDDVLFNSISANSKLRDIWGLFEAAFKLQRDLSLLSQESHKEILKLYHGTTQNIKRYISNHSGVGEHDELKNRVATSLLTLIQNSRTELLESDTENNNTTTVTTVLDPCIGLDSDLFNSISANSKLRDIWNIFQQAFKQQTENNNIPVNERPAGMTPHLYSFSTLSDRSSSDNAAGKLVDEAANAPVGEADDVLGDEADDVLGKAASVVNNANRFIATTRQSKIPENKMLEKITEQEEVKEESHSVQPCTSMR